MGSAALILKDIGCNISLYLSWEVDPACASLLQHHFPAVQARGDFSRDDPQEIVKLVSHHDPSCSMMVLIVGAPPCPDFSQIHENPPGAKGAEGQKFSKFCDFATAIEQGIPHKKVGYLVENVLLADKSECDHFSKRECDHFSKRLQCSAIAADAADFGLIGRPRLWWTRIDWATMYVNPLTNKSFRWSKVQRYHRVHLDAPLHEVHHMELDGLKFHPKVVSHELRLPCMTTPAPTEGGRVAPKRLRGRIAPDACQRWLAHGREFAPWHYHQEAMMQDQDGQLHIPLPEVKEQLHMLPVGFTRHPDVDGKARHRLLANGWHIGVARFMMVLVWLQPIWPPKPHLCQPCKRVHCSSFQWPPTGTQPA